MDPVAMEVRNDQPEVILTKEEMDEYVKTLFKAIKPEILKIQILKDHGKMIYQRNRPTFLSNLEIGWKLWSADEYFYGRIYREHQVSYVISRI